LLRSRRFPPGRPERWGRFAPPGWSRGLAVRVDKCPTGGAHCPRGVTLAGAHTASRPGNRLPGAPPQFRRWGYSRPRQAESLSSGLLTEHSPEAITQLVEPALDLVQVAEQALGVPSLHRHRGWLEHGDRPTQSLDFLSRATWEIEPVGDSCRLTVTHDQLRENANDQL
jgi:hypothetical protein